MKNKTLGIIGIVWGGLILVNWLISSLASSSSGQAQDGAYQSGQTIGLLFGVAMFGVGIYTVFFSKPKKT